MANGMLTSAAGTPTTTTVPPFARQRDRGTQGGLDRHAVENDVGALAKGDPYESDHVVGGGVDGGVCAERRCPGSLALQHIRDDEAADAAGLEDAEQQQPDGAGTEDHGRPAGDALKVPLPARRTACRGVDSGSISAAVASSSSSGTACSRLAATVK